MYTITVTIESREDIESRDFKYDLMDLLENGYCTDLYNGEKYQFPYELDVQEIVVTEGVQED